MLTSRDSVILFLAVFVYKFIKVANCHPFNNPLNLPNMDDLIYVHPSRVLNFRKYLFLAVIPKNQVLLIMTLYVQLKWSITIITIILAAEMLFHKNCSATLSIS